jgi:hypothetical protein
MTAADILPMLEDLYRRDPEYRHLQPWELQSLLWSLGYADELLDEEEIARADEARADETARKNFYPGKVA